MLAVRLVPGIAAVAVVLYEPAHTKDGPQEEQQSYEQGREFPGHGASDTSSDAKGGQPEEISEQGSLLAYWRRL